MAEDMAVIFDMDGVVMDNNKYHEKAWRRFCLQHNIHLTEEELHTHIFGRVARDTINYIFGKEHTNEMVDAFVAEKELIYRELYVSRIRPLRGLIPMLETLRDHHIPMALATSAPSGNVEFAFRHLPIRHFFRCVLDASDVEKGKPDPEIYEKTILRLGSSPGRTIVFEDSLAGIRSALGAGARVIGVTTTHRPGDFRGVSAVISDFTEIDLTDIKSILNKET